MAARLLVGVTAPVALFLCGIGCTDRRSAGSPPPPPPPPPPAAGYEAHLFAGGRAPPGAELHNPQARDKRSAAAGAKLFTAMNCDGCHGGGATGWVGPSLADGRWRYGGTDGALFQSIYYGRPHGMPGFGGILSHEAIWSLVTYLQSLEPPADVPTERWP